MNSPRTKRKKGVVDAAACRALAVKIHGAEIAFVTSDLLGARIAALFIELFQSPGEDFGWYDDGSKEHRVIALCLLAAIVEAGDA